MTTQCLKHQTGKLETPPVAYIFLAVGEFASACLGIVTVLFRTRRAVVNDCSPVQLQLERRLSSLLFCDESVFRCPSRMFSLRVPIVLTVFIENRQMNAASCLDELQGIFRAHTAAPRFCQDQSPLQ